MSKWAVEKVVGGMEQIMITTNLHDTWVEGWRSNLSVFASFTNRSLRALREFSLSFVIDGRLLFFGVGKLYIRPLWWRVGKISNMVCRILEIYRLALACSLWVTNEKLSPVEKHGLEIRFGILHSALVFR